MQINMGKHTHAGKPLFVPGNDVSAFLLGRLADWVVCDCGKIGLVSRQRRRAHTWLERPELKERAAKWNAEEQQRNSLEK